ncbi:tetratricopeptide repeat protein [Sandaracinus amylolyticus]|uniref:tetratricopeptide repeat protein n=1 Tax=Sandaracinus amylolyticus TaxID=927083 RepID=UPI001F1A09C4|nr:tetratricopeptide repeat protein [Sandaracinus amylolyticus]UJR80357.1 TPR domain protein, putative component of TonB system [Sandaracinus amylolyticus]
MGRNRTPGRGSRLALLAVASLIAGGLPLAVGAQEGARSSSPAWGGMCMSPAARQRVDECPTGAPPPSQRAGAGASAPATHLTQTKRREEEKKQGPTGPSIEIDAATARGREAVAARALDLLNREVQTTERIIGRMRDDDPRGADYLLRLAETYFELQTYWRTRAGSLDQPIFEAEQSGNRDQLQQLQRQRQEANGHLDEARQAAIRTYARLVQNYPNYSRMDEVLFSLAFGLEEMRQFERARQVYFRLIKGYPESRFIPYAYLSFAEYYFGEGQMREAQQFYTKVTEFPPERNPVYGYALYKQAWALYNLEDFRGALQQFARTVEFATQNPDARDAANLARQSRREMVLPYARVGRPNQALQFFRRYAENDAQAYEMLEALGELYYDTGQWPETIGIYHELMAEQASSDRLCYWQSRVTNAIVSSRPKPEQVTEIRRLIDMYNTYRQQSHPQEALNECRSATASVLVELSTAWHREAIGTDEQPGTNDRNTMNQASQLYRLTLDTFPDMDGMEFPDIDRRDWPTTYRVSYFYAELLWRMEDWSQCGPAFDRVVELNPQGEFTSDAAYAAVLCYNNLYQQQYAGNERDVRGRSGEQQEEEGGRGGRRGRRGRRAQQEQAEAAPTFEPQEFTPVQEGMLRAFQRFVCFVQDSEELPTVKYRRARIYYETNHFEEAAILFRDIAWNHRDSELAEFAANLYLDSLNMMGTRVGQGNPQCITELEQSLDPMHGFYCGTPEQRDAHPDLCEVVVNLRCDVVRLQAETLARQNRHREAADAYRRIIRQYRECGRLDEVIYNLAIEYEAARLLGRAIQARTTLIERFPESPLAKRAVYLVGANYHALAIYSRAADYYEQFATRYPGEDGSECTEAERTAGTCAIAHAALENAVFFRLGLGEEERAIEDVRLYERNYRRSRARETSQVVFSLGSIYERQGNWGRVFDHYRSFLRQYGRQALPHEVIRANVQMGRAQWELEERGQAEGYFRTATQVWTRGAGEAINRAEGTDEERSLWLARARDATSEALFYLAEYRFAEFRAIHFPRLPSTRTLASVTRWSTEDLAPWLQRKREALVTAEQAYNLIAELNVPQWQIAGAARIGEMYQRIVDDMRSAPIPEEIERDDELYGIYVDALEGALNGSGPGPDGRPFTPDDIACQPESTEPQCVNAPVRQAMSKFEFCLTLATRVRWFNEFSQQCEVQLNRLDAQRYPLAAELRGTASFIQDQIATPEPIELTTDAEEADAEGAASGDAAATGGGST